MLRKFKIKIDGKEYLVEMEEESSAQAQPSPAPLVQPLAVAEPVNHPDPQPLNNSTSVATDKEALSAPMPGTILKIFVKPGDAVEANQPLLILEAMKMENQIVANQPGTVQEIYVSVGDVVNPGDALITIA